jgi:hypothetical protein
VVERQVEFKNSNQSNLLKGNKVQVAFFYKTLYDFLTFSYKGLNEMIKP